MVLNFPIILTQWQTKQVQGRMRRKERRDLLTKKRGVKHSELPENNRRSIRFQQERKVGEKEMGTQKLVWASPLDRRGRSGKWQETTLGFLRFPVSKSQSDHWQIRVTHQVAGNPSTSRAFIIWLHYLPSMTVNDCPHYLEPQSPPQY